MGARIGRAVAAAVALGLALPACAAAWTVGENVSAAVATLPAGHPCRVGVEVQWVPGLRARDGRREAGEAPQGYVFQGVWFARSAETGAPMALPCLMRLDPVEWAAYTPCEQRRLVWHEKGHLGGLVDVAGGLMSTYADVREFAAVKGCPAFVPPLRDRVTARVLDLVPAGWSVSCGPLRRGLMRCHASSPSGRRVRYFRARPWSASGLAVVRVRRARG